MTVNDSTESSPRIRFDPAPQAIDRPVGIHLTGFKPFEEITLKVSSTDSINRTWSIEALYRMDKAGTADLASASVVNRLYPAGEYMQLFSLLELEDDGQTTGPPVFLSDVDSGIRYMFEAQRGGEQPVRAELQRAFRAPGIGMEKVRSKGIWGSFFFPEGAAEDPVPAVVVLGGAIGASLWTERAAALLAGHGCATLALTYFSTGQLPADLVEIPIEYFSSAISWLKNQPQVDEQRVGMLGKSKGAEAALLLGTLTSELNCYVCYSAPAVLYQGIQASGPILSARSSWTYRGRALPFVPCYQEGKPININTLNNLLQIHSLNLDSKSIAMPAGIAVEKVGAPVLLIAGEADDVWPSVRFGETIMSRLARFNRIRGSVLKTYPNAGHGIDLPGLPLTSFGGGTRSAIAAASSDAWQHCLDFFDKHLTSR